MAIQLQTVMDFQKHPLLYLLALINSYINTPASIFLNVS